MATAYWVGTYTGGAGDGRGIYRMRQGADGPLREPELVAEVENPSYLAVHPHRPVLYAVSERDSGAVLAYDVVDGQRLAPTGTVALPPVPCHVAVGADGPADHVLAASYGAGTVGALRLTAEGRLHGVPSIVPGHGSGPRADRQEAPHAHAVALAPDGTVLSTDLGADLVRASRIDPATGALTPVADVALPAGCGPRHLVVHPGGAVYVLTELASTVVVLTPGAGYADLTVTAESPATVAPVGDDALSAAIELGADGRVVYTSTRGADVVTTHEVGADGTALRPVADTPSGGHWPRDFCVDGPWMHVANERSGVIATFRLDPRTGVPEPVGPPAPVPSPVCVVPA
jgi:6-phosphogluconolactonase